MGEVKLVKSTADLFAVEYEGERAEFILFRNALAFAAGLADARSASLLVCVSVVEDLSKVVDGCLVPSSLAPVTVSAAQQETGCLCESDSCDMVGKIGFCPFDS